ncbi:MAG TPA: hydrolase TatD [Candidatus Moranbacteria bacterium]|nr:hydrolase TatD [Candidatus Moranbacteria bacterium]HAT74884.1 hydrolase TatD [Candidatus Moranbacteria bacterium]
MLIDTHTHLDDKQFDKDRDEVIARAFANGVKKIINVGAGLGSSRRSVELAEKYENIFAAVGFHPHYFNKYGESSFGKIAELRELARHKKVIAVGEIGLDYFSHNEKKIGEKEKESQKAGFISQLDLARKLNLPVIIHCRDAYDDCYEIMQKYVDLKFVFHCYGGNMEFTKKLLWYKNIHFSFTGNITYAKAGSEIIEAIKKIPMNKIILETDCPYLAPTPMRGKRNEPLLVRYIGKKIAELKNFSEDDASRITTKNASRFFGFVL